MATVAGVIVGLVAGYFGGWIDTILARFIDAVLAFPFIVLALALAAIYGPSLTIVIGVIAFFSWAGISRIVRGQTLSIKEKEYIEAARSLGAGPWRIMFIDILPNLMAPVLVLATLYIPTAIVFEATLSFLGIGIPAPAASWGDHPVRGAAVLPGVLVVRGLPGHRAAAHHARVQPARRRDQGRDGPTDRTAVRGRAGAAGGGLARPGRRSQAPCLR